MTPPDEVVCETEAAFRDACWKYGAFVPGCAIKACEEAHGWKDVRVPVRVVYRPPAPKPDPVDKECARRHAFAEWVKQAALARCGMLPKEEEYGKFGGVGLEVEKLWWSFLDYEGKQERKVPPVPPAPPVDVALEAFNAWAESAGLRERDGHGGAWQYVDLERYRGAFLAGRASVKP